MFQVYYLFNTAILSHLRTEAEKNLCVPGQSYYFFVFFFSSYRYFFIIVDEILFFTFLSVEFLFFLISQYSWKIIVIFFRHNNLSWPSFQGFRLKLYSHIGSWGAKKLLMRSNTLDAQVLCFSCYVVFSLDL